MKTLLILATIVCFVAGLKAVYRHREKEVNEGKFPFAVSIIQRDFFHTHICGGFIYNEYWVVTTASCVEGKLNTLAVVAGRLNFVQKQLNEQTIAVTGIYIPDEYSVRSKLNKFLAKSFRVLEQLDITAHKFETIPSDIALLQLLTKLKFDDDGNFTTIPDPTELKVNSIEIGSVDPSVPIGTVMGWGKNIRSEFEQPKHGLLYFPVDIIEDSFCEEYNNFHRSTMICAASTVTDTAGAPCYIDQGYPLVQETSNGLVAVGIVSHPSCSLDSPSVFTRLTKFYPRILEIAGPSKMNYSEPQDNYID